MRTPKVLSVGFAHPEKFYTQEELFKSFGYPSAFKTLFTSAGIGGRYFAMPPQFVTTASMQEQQEVYAREARKLCQRAVKSCFGDKWSPSEVNSINYASCTGITPGPTMGHLIAQDFLFPTETYVTNIMYQGCDGGFPAFRRALDFVKATGNKALVVTCELSSCAYGPEERGPKGEPDPENEYELIRAHAIFGDGCSAVLIGYDDEDEPNPRYPYILDTCTYLQTQYGENLGFVWRNGRLRVRLSRKVPEIAEHLSGVVARKLLDKWGLTPERIDNWIIHPAGKKVLDMTRENLEIPYEKARYSYEALRRYGNCSSSTVGIVGKLMMEGEEAPGGYAMMLNVGPGMTGDATLFRFGEE